MSYKITEYEIDNYKAFYYNLDSVELPDLISAFCMDSKHHYGDARKIYKSNNFIHIKYTTITSKLIKTMLDS